ncbi:unnamed protein product [Darwinula stevensoni]|uniref:Uncharacterized protein n=1 Tax=Darwinula stevensoni TaxID=69355 RepID=A0A7R8XB99_9CRUS|nr:unnamed protein product [Darwinula stevensoni]CAG0884600.1 unnamed protein product [Darwinula stevensoni]
MRQPETQYLDIDAKASRRVAYINVTKQEAPLTIVYLPGFFGLKTGTKSDAIRFFCNQHGYNFLRVTQKSLDAFNQVQHSLMKTNSISDLTTEKITKK